MKYAVEFTLYFNKTVEADSPAEARIAARNIALPSEDSYDMVIQIYGFNENGEADFNNEL